MSYTERPSEEFISLLRKCGDSHTETAMAAQREFAQALELPLRKGVLVAIFSEIFSRPLMSSREEAQNILWIFLHPELKVNT